MIKIVHIKEKMKSKHRNGLNPKKKTKSNSDVLVHETKKINDNDYFVHGCDHDHRYDHGYVRVHSYRYHVNDRGDH